MKKILKALFCNHNFKFYRVTSGDENNYSIPNRKVEKCFNCERFKYSEMTDKDWLEYDLKMIGKDFEKVLNGE